MKKKEFVFFFIGKGRKQTDENKKCMNGLERKKYNIKIATN